MNIGIVTTWFERGAAYVSKQYYNTLKLKHDVFIYARGGEKYAENDINWNISSVTWGKKTFIQLPLAIDYQDFIKWIKKNRIEIVFFNEQQMWDPVLWCHSLGLKTGCYIDYYTEETIPFFSIYDFLICNTKRHYEVFKWHKQCYFIPWGTDISLFAPKNFDLVNEQVVTFFHSCGMSPDRKGTDLILRVFSKLNEEAKLIIHSQQNLKTFFPNLKEVIESLQKKGILTLIEKEIPAPGLYSLGDVYLYPSRLDGIGLTITEALAVGLPVITSDNAPMNEIINEKNGKLVKINKFWARFDGYYWPQCEVDLDDLECKIRFYINNKNKIKQYKIFAREYSEKFLDWTKNKNNIFYIFERSNILDYKNKKNIIKSIKIFEKNRSNYIIKLFKIKLFNNFPELYCLLKSFSNIIINKNRTF